MKKQTKQSITAFVYDKRGKLLSIGKNSYVKTHPLQKQHAIAVGEPQKEFLHAEVAAIASCRDLRKAYRMVVIRMDKSGNTALAKPCPICQRAISFTNIQVVEHT
jgi:tRNA(Arg) A34 adenosine deaminase TadA